eukprot:GHVR01042462.1.p1 GENE.GHVR01042462.1~~GHVR01042462.1.p1  ORF type:complete len:376 (+),score=110.92 GHVR01042462.1:210-1337(+)
MKILKECKGLMSFGIFLFILPMGIFIICIISTINIFIYNKTPNINKICSPIHNDGIYWENIYINDTSYPYYLFMGHFQNIYYKDIKFSNKSIPVLFVHGHQGTYADFTNAFSEVRHLQININNIRDNINNNIYNNENNNENNNEKKEYLLIQPFSIDYKSQPSAFVSSYIQTQSTYIDVALKHITHIYCNNQNPSKCRPKVVLVGFSMGGVAITTFLAHKYLEYFPSIESIEANDTWPVDLPYVVKAAFLTSSPVRSPPITSDISTLLHYHSTLKGLSVLQKSYAAVAIVSVGGGYPNDVEVIAPQHDLVGVISGATRTHISNNISYLPRVIRYPTHVGVLYCGHYFEQVFAPALATTVQQIMNKDTHTHTHTHG